MQPPSSNASREDWFANLSDEELVKETKFKISGFYGAHHYSEKLECRAWQRMQECISECERRNIQVEQWIEDSKAELRKFREQQQASFKNYPKS